ncbi:MAG: capsular polysaccharide synthesis protein [Pseudomonadota bacterium]
MSHLSHIRSKQVSFWARRALRKVGIGRPPPRQREPYPPESIPRILWLYWDKGLDAAPELVRACVDSWRCLNAEWDIRLLDAANVTEYVDMPSLPDTIASAHKADVLRTLLLAKHGGVWADATVWCLRPLDEWLPMAGYSGFFTFKWQNPDAQIITVPWPRMIGNWFIAAAPGNALIAEWDRVTCKYWQGRDAAGNYFWHNDALEYVIGADAAARQVWGAMPSISAGPPHFAWLALEHGTDKERARAAIATGAIPVQKLSWRMDAGLDEVKAILGAGRD